MGRDADPPEIQAIGVEAGMDGRVVVMVLVGMPGAGIEQLLEGRVVEELEQPTGLTGVFRAATAVLGVEAIV